MHGTRFEISNADGSSGKVEHRVKMLVLGCRPDTLTLDTILLFEIIFEHPMKIRLTLELID